jgi:hypothetical protein
MAPLADRVAAYLARVGDAIHTCNPNCSKPEHLVYEMQRALTARDDLAMPELLAPALHLPAGTSYMEAINVVDSMMAAKAPSRGEKHGG